MHIANLICRGALVERRRAVLDAGHLAADALGLLVVQHLVVRLHHEHGSEVSKKTGCDQVTRWHIEKRYQI